MSAHHTREWRVVYRYHRLPDGDIMGHAPYGEVRSKVFRSESEMQRNVEARTGKCSGIYGHDYIVKHRHGFQASRCYGEVDYVQERPVEPWATVEHQPPEAFL